MAESESREQVGITAESRSWTRMIPDATGLGVLLAALLLAAFARHEDLPLWQPITLAAIAFCCEFIDSSLGMGYGTTFTPLLILMGFDLKVVVPVILLSEFVTGLAAGGFHHALGNATFRRGSRDSKVAGVLAMAGILGAIGAVQFLTRVPQHWARLYFALMITAMGAIVVIRHRARGKFTWPKVAGLGLVSAFNKGMSGGGYGPLVVSGQVLAGCGARNAIACTSIAESLVCLAGLIGFAIAGIFPTPHLAVPILAGAILSAPCASAMTRFLDSRVDLRRLVGVVVLMLGLLCLWKVLTG
jgi:uncharacterized membrane protein YfcA